MFSQVTVSVRVFILLPSTGCSSRITTNSGKTPSSKALCLRRNLFIVTHDSCFYVWEGRVSFQECNFVWREEINGLTDWQDKYFSLGQSVFKYVFRTGKVMCISLRLIYCVMDCSCFSGFDHVGLTSFCWLLIKSSFNFKTTTYIPHRKKTCTRMRTFYIYKSVK